MDLKTLKDRIETVKSLATIPAVAKRVLELVGDPSVSLGEISRFISQDPSLTSKVLKMVNSPIYGFPGRISSVDQAVLLLGLDVVRGLLFGVTVFDLMRQTMIGLWEHSMGCAILSRLIASRKGLKDVEEASINGLLHDIGKVILLLEYPGEYEKAMNEAREKELTVFEVEADYFSTTHATVGAWVAEQWSFPKRLVDVIQYHHKPHLAKIVPMETAIVHFSDVLLRGRGFGFAGDYYVPQLYPSTWDLLGLSEADIKAIFLEAEELIEESADLSL